MNGRRRIDVCIRFVVMTESKGVFDEYVVWCE